MWGGNTDEQGGAKANAEEWRSTTSRKAALWSPALVTTSITAIMAVRRFMAHVNKVISSRFPVATTSNAAKVFWRRSTLQSKFSLRPLFRSPPETVAWSSCKELINERVNLQIVRSCFPPTSCVQRCALLALSCFPSWFSSGPLSLWS